MWTENKGARETEKLGKKEGDRHEEGERGREKGRIGREREGDKRGVCVWQTQTGKQSLTESKTLND